MTQARAPLASDGDHEPSSKLPSLTRENYIRHIVFNRRMANVYRAIDQPRPGAQKQTAGSIEPAAPRLASIHCPTALRREPARLYS